MISPGKYLAAPLCLLVAAAMSCGDGPCRPGRTPADSIRFASPIVVGAGESPMSLIARDLDGDGDHDLAVANRFGDNVSVFMNDGGMSLGTPVGYKVGNYPSSVHAGDLDGDRDLDLMIANASSGSVSILKNKGGGVFEDAMNLLQGLWAILDVIEHVVSNNNIKICILKRD